MIYLDNAATTPLLKRAYEKMAPYHYEIFGNPSELYDYSSKSRKAVNEARVQVAKLIGADITEIYFTSGGTESDNQAILGTAYANRDKGKHIITTNIEHHAVTNTCRFLADNGYDITYIHVSDDGLIDPADIKKAIREDTVLISVMFANNEIGVIQPVKEIGAIAREHNIIFHTDAVAAFAHTMVNVNDMNIDLLSASAHKCNGPKGVGLLYIKDGVSISPFHFGGRQERNMRPGTENVPGIVGFGEACAAAAEKDNYNCDYVRLLANYFIERVTSEIDDVLINGDRKRRVAGNVSFSFADVQGEAVQIQLDLKGICCSTGSACNAVTSALSHVIKAINVPEEYAYGTVRFTLSDMNTIGEIDYTVDILKETIRKLRNI